MGLSNVKPAEPGPRTPLPTPAVQERRPVEEPVVVRTVASLERVIDPRPIQNPRDSEGNLLRRDHNGVLRPVADFDF